MARNKIYISSSDYIAIHFPTATAPKTVAMVLLSFPPSVQLQQWQEEKTATKDVWMDG